MITYYPAQDFAYGSDVLVEVLYNNQELQRFNFHVRPLPTFVQGFVSDQLLQPAVGVPLNRTAIKKL